MSGLPDIYENQAKFAQAEPLYNRVLATRRRVLGMGHVQTLDTLVALGRLLLQQRKYREAEGTLQEALATYEKAKPDLWERYHCQSVLVQIWDETELGWFPRFD
jgi:hypothetical protein